MRHFVLVTLFLFLAGSSAARSQTLPEKLSAQELQARQAESALERVLETQDGGVLSREECCTLGNADRKDPLGMLVAANTLRRVAIGCFLAIFLGLLVLGGAMYMFAALVPVLLIFAAGFLRHLMQQARMSRSAVALTARLAGAADAHSSVARYSSLTRMAMTQMSS